ncbi:MAG: methyltransferase [Gammaproteobacteria bacterium]|jgi:caffeoyl-CoA O-methyltransferase|nr:methyltransferase [Gammaproteobacteria bacterium]
MKDWSAVDMQIETYAAFYSSSDSALLQQLANDTKAMTGSQMLSGRLVGQLLRILIKLRQAKTVLDIGTYTGYSALSMAEALPQDGQVITIESSKPALDIANKYFTQSQHASKIKPMLGEALELLPQLSGSFDLIFIDADKLRILEYYEHSLAKLNSGGVMVIDDVLWRGEVLEPEPSDKRAQVMQKLNQHILQDHRVENLLLPLRHGLNVVLKI